MLSRGQPLLSKPLYRKQESITLNLSFNIDNLKIAQRPAHKENRRGIKPELYSRRKNVDRKQEIHVSIQSKHFCLPKNLKIEINKTIILSVVLYGCETWPLALKEERRLRVFENRNLRRLFGPHMVSGEGSTMRNFIVCIVHVT